MSSVLDKCMPLFGLTVTWVDVMPGGQNYGHWKGVKISKNLEYSILKFIDFYLFLSLFINSSPVQLDNDKWWPVYFIAWNNKGIQQKGVK